MAAERVALVIGNRQEKLDFQLAIAEGFLAKNKISLVRQALQDAKQWDRQGKVEFPEKKFPPLAKGGEWLDSL